MNLYRKFVALLTCLLMPVLGWAGLPTPTVDYSADRVIESEQSVFSGRVHVSKGKERSVMSMEGMEMVTITRPDKKVIWMLMPMQGMYQEMALDVSSAERTGAVPDDVEISLVGQEKIEGLQASKYKLIMKDKSAGGFVWMTEEAIPVRMDLLSRDKSGKTHMKMLLKNIKIGPQDPALFEIPKGFHKMPAMGAMGRMPGR